MPLKVQTAIVLLPGHSNQCCDLVGLPDSEIDKYEKEKEVLTYTISEDGTNMKLLLEIEGKPSKTYNMVANEEKEDSFDGMKEKVGALL